MEGSVECPECGKRSRRGSTFCMGCGNRLPNGHVPTTSEASEDVLPEASELDDVPDLGEPPAELEILPDTELPDVDEPVIEEEPPSATPTSPEEGLSWEVDERLVESTTEEVAAPEPIPVSPPEAPAGSSSDLSWEVEGVDPEIKVGMPFKEVAPPRVMAEEIEVHPVEVFDHLFPEGKDDPTRDAVTHLFPGGRGVTSKDFIDTVVGTPKRIAVTTPMPELDTPDCPNCGFSISGDGFEYPGYVYEAMGKARMEDGFGKLEAKQFEPAIETFEMAKKLFERAANEKAIADATKMIDEGYDAMANDHFEQAENHRKANEYEWAIVQFRKARELYMFSTDAKKRAKCSEKVRDCYVEWGKVLEDEGDALAKAGQTRKALTKYQEAAQRYREGEDDKKLKSLDKKIRKA
ncbi:MAG: tol-pal system YbgF family protein [Promethearchaeota archaeon]